MRCALSLFLLFLIAGVFSSSAFAAAPRLSADDPVVRKALASLEGKRILVELRVPEGSSPQRNGRPAYPSHRNRYLCTLDRSGSMRGRDRAPLRNVSLSRHFAPGETE
jgi:hypothetical protein